MLVNGDALARASQLRNQAANRARIELIEASLDDLWLRDTGPVFVVNAARQLRAVDFNFNGWGRKQRFGMGAGIATAVAQRAGTAIHKSGLTLESGGLEVAECQYQARGRGGKLLQSCPPSAQQSP
jgi:agmatine/peptidylarginine deiminase